MRRLFATALLIAAAGCASDTALRSELLNLKEEVRALDDRNAELSRRLDRLEEKNTLMAAAETSPPIPASAELPNLTVVRLKPRLEAAPKMDLSIPVVEPSEAWLAQLDDAPVERRGSSQAAVEQEFEAGIAALKTGNLSGGVGKLQRLASDYPKHPKADDALYLSGLGLMGLGDYRGAAISFEQVISNYPAGNVVQDSMLRLAECRIRLNKLGEARRLYTQLLARYPGSAAAVQAEQRLGSLTP